MGVWSVDLPCLVSSLSCAVARCECARWKWLMRKSSRKPVGKKMEDEKENNERCNNCSSAKCNSMQFCRTKQKTGRCINHSSHRNRTSKKDTENCKTYVIMDSEAGGKHTKTQHREWQCEPESGDRRMRSESQGTFQYPGPLGYP